MKTRILVCLLVVLACGNRQACAQTTSIRPVIGGMPSDSGFALGAEIRRTRLVGPVDGRIKAVGSLKKYELLEAGIEVPAFIKPWLSLAVTGRYRDYPQEDFWGLGPGSREENRSNFLLEDVDTTATLTATIKRFRAGTTAGYLRINTGPGRDTRFPSVAEELQKGPRYNHAGLFVQYDWLNDPADPRLGGKYVFRWTTFSTAFQRYEVDVRQFVPVASRDTVAFRFQSIFTGAASAEVVPFFMLPTAGGTDTIRGFNQYRFRDNDTVVLNAEYRRPLTDFLEAVGFVDAGRVFPRAGDFTLRGLQPSEGGGVRVKFGTRVFFGIDLGFSKEGHQLWFRSEHMF